MKCKQRSPHLIRWEEIYGDVIRIYTLSLVILAAQSFDDERAINSGGAFKNMISGFWDVDFKKLFDGPNS